LRRIWKHLRIGRRWLIGGGRLFMHNPWLLGGMGFMTAILISAVALIPLLGALLVALLAPVLLGSAYLAIDGVYRQKMVLPASLRLPALKQSPRQLFVVFRDEARLVPTAVACIYSAAGMVLINLPLQLLPGDVWVANWSSLDRVSLLGVLAMALFALLLYIVLAASLIYALPLTFLRDEPLIPSLLRSLKASRHFVFALLLLLSVLLIPFLLGAAVSLFSLWAGYFAWLIASSIVLPAVVTSLYCSYQDIFANRESTRSGDYSPVHAIAR
jgi:hypothetical protein